ncbi:MAG: O-antigen ligase family protein, partial [Nitrospirota bacterium]|nr:O-antigen ligase family protein [Nitrospirota bacterium]
YGRIDLPLPFFILCAGLATSIFADVDWKTAFNGLKWPAFGYILMIAAIAVSSLLNSPDNLYSAANVLGRLGVGLMVILWIGSILNTHKRHSIHADRIIRVFLFSALPLGIMGIIFLIYPELEGRWLNMIAGILIEADSTAIKNNIRDINRVGVVFMDVNTASVFWGMSMWLALWMQQKSHGLKKLPYMVLALIFFLDIIATGSRAGILALILTLVISSIIRTAYHQKDRKKTANRIVIIFPAIIVITVLSLGLMGHIKSEHIIFNDTIDRFKRLASQDPVTSDKRRANLLKFSINAIKQKPLFGHGVIDFAKLDFPDGFPPHNMFLMTWIYGGLPALFGLVWLFATIPYRLFRRSGNNHDNWLPIVIISWIIIQGSFIDLMIVNFRVSMLLWLIIIPLLLSPNTIPATCSDN